MRERVTLPSGVCRNPSPWRPSPEQAAEIKKKWSTRSAGLAKAGWAIVGEAPGQHPKTAMPVAERALAVARAPGPQGRRYAVPEPTRRLLIGKAYAAALPFTKPQLFKGGKRKGQQKFPAYHSAQCAAAEAKALAQRLKNPSARDSRTTALKELLLLERHHLAQRGQRCRTDCEPMHRLTAVAALEEAARLRPGGCEKRLAACLEGVDLRQAAARVQRQIRSVRKRLQRARNPVLGGKLGGEHHGGWIYIATMLNPKDHRPYAIWIMPDSKSHVTISAPTHAPWSADQIGRAYWMNRSELSDVTSCARSHVPGGVGDKGKGLGLMLYSGLALAAGFAASQSRTRVRKLALERIPDSPCIGSFDHGEGGESRSEAANQWWTAAVKRGYAEEVEGGSDPQPAEGEACVDTDDIKESTLRRVIDDDRKMSNFDGTLCGIVSYEVEGDPKTYQTLQAKTVMGSGMVLHADRLLVREFGWTKPKLEAILAMKLDRMAEDDAPAWDLVEHIEKHLLTGATAEQYRQWRSRVVPFFVKPEKTRRRVYRNPAKSGRLTTYVMAPGGMKFVKNLGWLLRRASKELIRHVLIQDPIDKKNGAHLVVMFEDGVAFHSDFASKAVLLDWLKRPTFRGVKVYDISMLKNPRRNPVAWDQQRVYRNPAKRYFEDMPEAERKRIIARYEDELLQLFGAKFPFRARHGHPTKGDWVTVLGPSGGQGDFFTVGRGDRGEPVKKKATDPATLYRVRPDTPHVIGGYVAPDGSWVPESTTEVYLAFATSLYVNGKPLVTPTPPLRPLPPPWWLSQIGPEFLEAEATNPRHRNPVSYDPSYVRDVVLRAAQRASSGPLGARIPDLYGLAVKSLPGLGRAALEEALVALALEGAVDLIRVTVPKREFTDAEISLLPRTPLGDGWYGWVRNRAKRAPNGFLKSRKALSTGRDSIDLNVVTPSFSVLNPEGSMTARKNPSIVLPILAAGAAGAAGAIAAKGTQLYLEQRLASRAKNPRLRIQGGVPNPSPETAPLTVTLPGLPGLLVLARLYRGRPAAYTFANLKQARDRAAPLGEEWTVYGRRPYYVAREAVVQRNAMVSQSDLRLPAPGSPRIPLRNLPTCPVCGVGRVTPAGDCTRCQNPRSRYEAIVRQIVDRLHVGLSDAEVMTAVAKRLRKGAPERTVKAILRAAVAVHHQNQKLYGQVQRGSLGRQRNSPSGRPRKVRQIPVAEARRLGVPGLDAALKAYRKFHKGEPDSVAVYDVPDGKAEQRAVVRLGKAWAIGYEVEAGVDSNKSSTQWEHAFGEVSGLKPDLVYDPRSKMMSIVGGRARVSDWLHD